MGDLGTPIRETERHRAEAAVELDGPPLVGFRRWGVRRSGLYSGIFVAGRFVPTPALTMVAPRVRPMPWPPHEDRVAKCFALRGHEAPYSACNCGFSAYYELPEEPDLPAPDAVWGVIAGWGRLVEHELGFRAQFARAVALLDDYNPLDFARPGKRLRDAAEAYGIPLLPRDELIAYAGWHGELH
ncbi:MAG TPA: hypothetical protein VHZ75_05240 [Solirubrobacteraceae bacterium]|jgi:hypothetical protein|nr:hypothetical protein [Solirubrobacteraceae bacterium]